MKRFGSDVVSTPQKMDTPHLFFFRLHLLIIMVKSRLEGYPAGVFRTNAALENTAELQRLAADLSVTVPGGRSANHLFKERVKLLCIMATAMMSDGYPLGVHRRAAILENIDIIANTAFPHKKLTLFHDILKAA